MDNESHQRKMHSEALEMQKQYQKYYLLFLGIAIAFIAFFFSVRSIIKDENISRLLIFPVFVAVLIIEWKLIKKMTQARRNIKLIARKLK